MDPLSWWRTNASKFPILAIMARNYLAIPATSASSERVFSTTGNIVTRNRNRLTGKTLEMLISLNKWGIAEEMKDSDENESESRSSSSHDL